jgi:hypothetical protein
VPRNRDEWIGWLDKIGNHPQLVLRMVRELYPGLDPPPTHGQIGGIARKMGRDKHGYRRLMGLIWDYNGKRIDGDLLPYLLRVHQGKERDNGRERDPYDASDRKGYLNSEFVQPIDAEEDTQ